VAPKREGGTLDDHPRRLTVRLGAFASVGGINRLPEIAPTTQAQKTFLKEDSSRNDEFLELERRESDFVGVNRAVQGRPFR
jgi:hypothetical protein